MLDSYMECALWSSLDDTEHLDSNYSIDDISSETKNKMKEDCEKFYSENFDDLQTWEGNAESQAGHDFWLTRNGHGCGFWESEWGNVGDRLTERCKAFGQFDLYVGDDGKIYHM